MKSVFWASFRENLFLTPTYKYDAESSRFLSFFLQFSIEAWKSV